MRTGYLSVNRFIYSYVFLILIWLFLGFAAGTVVLLFPLRSWVDFVREKHLSAAQENVGVIVMMLLLAATTFFCSMKIFKWQRSKKRISITASAILVPFFCAAGALGLFMNPNVVNKGTQINTVTKQFTIGPYPTAEKIEALKREGFTGVISLLHPAVVPFEPQLIADEEAACRKNKIDLIKAPMLPWVGDNTASLKVIEDIVKSGTGKFYVHCYLGKDRVNMVKNLILKLTGNASIIEQKSGNTSRSFEQQKSFERGNIFKLADGIYMTPYPTNEELLAFFEAGSIKTVVNLMDSSLPENKKWITDEQKHLQTVGINFKNFSLTTSAPEQFVLTILDSLNGYPKPLVVHHWNTTCPESKLFRKYFVQKTSQSPLNLATNVSETY